jgi:EmrB/QacA subfamily drug resistance transporter
MVVLDISITNVALPSIERSLHFASDSDLQWVITAYALTFGGFLLLGGRAADLFGRRMTLLIGMSCFTLFSLLIGISQNATELIALRALQGLAAALMSPAALSIVLATFTEGRERGQALGYWATIATGGAALGLLLGGFSTQFFGWEWNFFINVPVGIVMVLAILAKVPRYESKSEHKHLDLPGALLVTTGLIALVFAISSAPHIGWLSPLSIGVFLLAALLLAGFIWNESRSKYPLVPLSIFSIRNVSGANLAMVPLYGCVLGVFFIATLYMQSTLHYSPIAAGFAFLPFPIVLGIVSSNIPRFVERYGYKVFAVLGPILVALAIMWLVRLPLHGNYWFDILPTLLLMPIGMGMTFMPIITAATSGVAPSESGLASGLINTSQQIGGAVGLAILSGIASAAASTASPIATLIGYRQAFAIAATFALISAFISYTVINERRSRQDAPAFA